MVNSNTVSYPKLFYPSPLRILVTLLFMKMMVEWRSHCDKLLSRSSELILSSLHCRSLTHSLPGVEFELELEGTCRAILTSVFAFWFLMLVVCSQVQRSSEGEHTNPVESSHEWRSQYDSCDSQVLRGCADEARSRRNKENLIVFYSCRFWAGE